MRVRHGLSDFSLILLTLGASNSRGECYQINWYEEQSDGSLDLPQFLSAARRLALEVREGWSHGLGGEARAGLETRGQRELSAEEREESRVEEAESVGRLEKASRGGRETVTLGAREEGDRVEITAD